jgi:hypothetical protein
MSVQERFPVRRESKVWRKPVGVEPTLPTVMREAAGFEDREGHRAPLASDASVSQVEDVPGRIEVGGRTPNGPLGRVRFGRLAVEETNLSGARTFGRLLGRELDSLTFAKQFENGVANRGAVEEMFDAAFVSNKPEPLVDQQTCNRAVRHDRSFSGTPRESCVGGEPGSV